MSKVQQTLQERPKSYPKSIRIIKKESTYRERIVMILSKRFVKNTGLRSGFQFQQTLIVGHLISLENSWDANESVPWGLGVEPKRKVRTFAIRKSVQKNTAEHGVKLVLEARIVETPERR